MADRALTLSPAAADSQTELLAWLADPPRRLPFDRLPAAWRQVEIKVAGPRPEGLPDGVVLLNRVRGALGQALLEGASSAARQRLPCTWTPPCALDLLFRQRPLAGLKAGAPPPYSLAADVGGRHLVVTLTLFGIAAEACAAEVADALVRGLRGGLAAGAEGAVAAVDVDHREFVRCEALARPAPEGEAVALRYLTPPAPRSGNGGGVDGVALLRGMFERVIGMARWLGLGVSDAEPWLADRLGRVQLDGARLLQGPAHFRHSETAPAGGYAIPVLSGALRIGGDWRRLWPLLLIGEAVHGGRATQGYGRFRIEPMAA
ncbi:MAG: hypothetical protein KIT25_16985 [Enhydrobacter sp.]|nr:MAG: hypothetical protein KIT25_16985 [Enhydrobacter sp.]